MKQQRSIKGELFAIGVSLIVLIITASQMIGLPARLVMILTIVAASLSVGISVGRLIEKMRTRKDDGT